ncbi:MAG: PilZ domain-containing protein [Elusimicrobia bacterium]|nr:PilZ domain-containing protein [Elusimicrobiota bacterium]MDE2510416.1 PilZ domain-containing protein [Elusimicrobiota bacterium]
MSDKKTGAERRQHRRFSVVEGMIEPITLQLGTDSKSQPVIMTDLSAGGMSLLMFCEPPHTKNFEMVLAIPGLDRTPIEAAIVRVHQKGETYSVGLSFIKIAKKFQEFIGAMADDNADCETRVALRLPEACVPNCKFHMLCAKPVKASHHWKK